MWSVCPVCRWNKKRCEWASLFSKIQSCVAASIAPNEGQHLYAGALTTRNPLCSGLSSLALGDQSIQDHSQAMGDGSWWLRMSESEVSLMGLCPTWPPLSATLLWYHSRGAREEMFSGDPLFLSSDELQKLVQTITWGLWTLYLWDAFQARVWTLGSTVTVPGPISINNVMLGKLLNFFSQNFPICQFKTIYLIILLLFNCSVMSDSLLP